MKAIDLFDGGESGIRKRITEAVRKRLKEAELDDLALLEEASHLKNGILVDLRENGDQVDFALFEKVGSAFGVSQFEVFGKPRWKGKDKKAIKEHWEKERKSNRLVATAFCGGGSDQINIPLDMYVTLRAIQEMRS